MMPKSDDEQRGEVPAEAAADADGRTDGADEDAAAPDAPAERQGAERHGAEQPDAETVAGWREAAARAGQLEDRLRRAEAEFVNETRRIQRQADEGRKYAIEGLVRELLPVFDALHSARESLGEGEAAESVRQGLDLVERELAQVLARHGLERIEAQDEPFDPQHHEAILVVDAEDRPPSTVAHVLRPGFKLRDRVVRPAHVAVTRTAEDDDADEKGS